MEKAKILVVDDEGELFEYCKNYVGEEFEFVWAKDGPEALKLIGKGEQERPKLVLLDKNFSTRPRSRILGPDAKLEGLYLIREFKKASNLPIIMVTTYPDPESVGRALELGANDYLEWSALELDSRILTFKLKTILRDISREKELLSRKFESLGMVGRTRVMLEIFREIENSAVSDATLLITGETGTGKELTAEIVHVLSGRKGLFIPVNLANLPETLCESELFGSKRGAFTGAVDRVGLLEVAQGGTLFLDEVSEMPASIQVKLLRVLENKPFIPVGGREPVKVDVRIIAATNRNLEEMVKKGAFRKDLFYRLSALKIHLPSLSQRRGDIPLLIDHFVRLFARSGKVRARQMTDEAKSYLSQQEWPGNVRELKQLIVRALNTSERVVTLRDVIKLRNSAHDEEDREECNWRLCPYLSNHSLKEIEKMAFVATMSSNKGDIRKTAESLGVSLTTVYKKAQAYGLVDLLRKRASNPS